MIPITKISFGLQCVLDIFSPKGQDIRVPQGSRNAVFPQDAAIAASPEISGLKAEKTQKPLMTAS